MLDLFDELHTLIEQLENTGIHYALCGGLAMAVHGLPRATVDIDLLILPEMLTDTLQAGRKCGFILEADPMLFADGAVEIHRISKIDPSTGTHFLWICSLSHPDCKQYGIPDKRSHGKVEYSGLYRGKD